MDKKELPLEEIQKQIQKQIYDEKQLDGWLIYDFQGSNALGLEVLGIDPKQHLTRRFFYWIPKQGSPLKIVHQIESHTLKHLPGDQIAYESWQSLDLALKSTLKGRKRIAMEHSPFGAIPVLSKLDAGLYQWLQDKKIDVVSSWPIAKHFICSWTSSQLKAHKEASKFLLSVFEESFEQALRAIKAKKPITECQLQEQIIKKFAASGFVTEHQPIVAYGAHSALPHYSPSAKTDATIEPEQLLLLDLWCKKMTPHAPYADITQVAFLGKKPPQKMIDVYSAVKEAQDAAIEFIKKTLKAGKEVTGAEVDDVCRSTIQKRGFGKYFVHRTGHNIHTMLHGLGPNLDNFETNDRRELLPLSCYSVEPGIYIPKAFGCRLECNIFIHENLKVEVTGASHESLPCLY